MKKFLFAILITAISSVCYAQRIKVHQGNNINSFLLSDVDSITHDGNESVTVYYDSQPSTFSVNNVDSLSINSERIECHNIISEQLNGWDESIFSISNDGEDFYIVSKTDTDEDGKETVIICINSFANDVLEKTINFIFDKEGNLQEIVTAGYQFKAQKYLDEFVFAVYKNGEYIDSFSVPCDVINENGTITNNSSRRRSYSNPIFNCKGKISLPKIKDFAGKAGGILKPVGDALGIAVNLDEGKYGEILMNFVVGGLISLADLPLVAGIIAEEGIKGLLKFIYEQDKKRLLGDAQIEITSVKRINEAAITVEGTISNISSIPSTVMVGSMSDGYFDETPNKVYWGIAEGKSGQPGMYLNDNSTGTMQISSDKFTYTFYIDRIPGQVLYFRPFLAPEITMQSIYTCIRYGERKEFIDVDVELSNFKQTKCYKENDKYKAQFTIDGSIPGLFQELSGWGIDVKTKSESYWQRFNAKENPNDYYPPIEKSFTCDITITDEDITDSGAERIAEIKITPYVSYWNRLPSATFLDEKIYTIICNTPPPPVATTGDYSNINKTSATVSCSYENVPEGGVCGVEYTWDEGSCKQAANSSDGTQTITLNGLKPGTTYTYCAYIEADGQTYYGEDKTFTTKYEIPDITGVWNCIEYQNGQQTGTVTFELKADKTVFSTNANGTCSFYSTSKGTWSIKEDGRVYIGFSYSAPSFGASKSYNGMINSFNNPSQIEGTSKFEQVTNMQGHYTHYEYDFIMTR